MRGENCWYDMLEASRAIRTGHFRLSSGQHSGMYIQCAKVLEDPARGEALGAALAREMQCDALSLIHI